MVANDGKPSTFEASAEDSPRPDGHSPLFAPLQSLFGIDAPDCISGHQGWWDIKSVKHRLMLNGSTKIVRAMVFNGRTDALAVGRPLSLNGAVPIRAWWGNVAVPPVSTHGMLSLQ
jgi:hypothetical protein